MDYMLSTLLCLAEAAACYNGRNSTMHPPNHTTVDVVHSFAPTNRPTRTTFFG